MLSRTASPPTPCLESESGVEEEALRAQAKQILHENGCLAVAEQLSRPVIHTFPPDLLPWLAHELIQAQDEPMHITPVTLSADFLAAPGSVPHINASCMNASVLKTGCATLDDLFDGGIPVEHGDILEISGTAGVGKTQIAIQLALMSAIPQFHGGLASKAVFAFTEGPPPIRRITQVATALSDRFNLSRNSLLSSIVVEKVDSVDDLLYWADVRLPHLLRQSNARVVLIDSVTALYRPEFEDAMSRANHLALMAMALRRAVNRVQGVCICVNQVSQRFEIDVQTLSTIAPALGVTWANCVATRVFLSKRAHGDVKRFARILHSSYLPVTDAQGVPYVINESGVTLDAAQLDIRRGQW